jgi:hypothetical protein
MPEISMPRNANSVLVAGQMNPTYHHPTWYHSIGAITADELKESLKEGNAGSTPIGSKFEFGSPTISVMCQPNLWVVRSNEEGSWERLLAIASLVFSPQNGQELTAYGLMAQRHMEVACDAKAVLAQRVQQLNLGFVVGHETTSNLVVSDTVGAITTTTSVQSSVLGNKFVYGLFHHDYRTTEIESILDGRFESFASASNKFFSHVTGAISSYAEEGVRHG